MDADQNISSIFVKKKGLILQMTGTLLQLLLSELEISVCPELKLMAVLDQIQCNVDSTK